MKEQNYIADIIRLIRECPKDADIADRLSDYHESDIAEALAELSAQERHELYPRLDIDYVSAILAYMDDVQVYVREMSPAYAAKIIGAMDADDAVDVLDEIDEERRAQIIALMDKDSSKDVQLIWSYDDDEIGSKMTTNFISIPHGLSVREATQSLIRQAGENDNIGKVYVTENGRLYGAIKLKDLICARSVDELEPLISVSYPFLLATEKVKDCIERIKGYYEDSLPVLNDRHELLGVITSHDVVEAVDDELGEDYAKLAGLTAEEDLKETTIESMKKRLPWLIVLLFLGIGVSSVVGIFEGVVASLPIIICFQSLILDMAGNVGTQSLAVTIRVLMDEGLTPMQMLRLVFKEIKVGLCNGLFLGFLSFLFIGAYIFFFKSTPLPAALLTSACVGVALMAAMIISSLVGTVVPMFFHKIKVDPAVASGPLITTVNDLVAVITYYGLAWLLLIQLFHLA